MIEVNIHHIPEEGMDFEATMPSSVLEIDDLNRADKVTPVVCELNASMSEKNLIVRGVATMVIYCKCDRCLEDTEVIVEAEDICIVVENTPDIVDLTNDIREDILLAFPQLYLCDPDCKGLCFGCGENLNKNQCTCEQESEEPSPWDTLDNLNFDDDK